MKKIKDGKIVIAAIISLTILDVVALMNGIDGILMTTVMAIIAGLAGWTIPSPGFLKR